MIERGQNNERDHANNLLGQTIDGDDGCSRLVGGSRGTGAGSHLAICAIPVSQVGQATDVNALLSGEARRIARRLAFVFGREKHQISDRGAQEGKRSVNQARFSCPFAWLRLEHRD
jgi:hypothetical protein